MNSNDPKYRSSIRREDIDNYSKMSPEQQHELEKKVLQDPFDSDAMDGWEKLGYNTSILNKLDKKFLNNHSGWVNLTVYILGIFAITITAIAIYNQGQKINEDDNYDLLSENNQKEQTIYVDKIDVITDTFIERLPEARYNQTASAPILQKKFKDEKALPELPEITFEIDDLPVIELNVEPSSKTVVKNRTQAKEIYLSDLKLIDYRNYRSKPVIPTEQLVLTGVPANMENQESTEMESTWKKIDVPYHEYIQKTMKYVADGNYKKALQRFNVIITSYPDDLNAHFYSGICYYNLEQYQKAVEGFDQCLRHGFSNFDEEALWLIANIFELQGKTEEARTLYEEIAEKKGFYSEYARKKLKK